MILLAKNWNTVLNHILRFVCRIMCHINAKMCRSRKRLDILLLFSSDNAFTDVFQVCDVIASWEKAYLKYASKQDHIDTSRTVKLTYKNRLYFKSLIRSETEKERLLLTYQTNEEIINGRFPLNRDLAVELAALMAQVSLANYQGSFYDNCFAATNMLTRLNMKQPFENGIPGIRKLPCIYCC